MAAVSDYGLNWTAKRCKSVTALPAVIVRTPAMISSAFAVNGGKYFVMSTPAAEEQRGFLIYR